MPALGDGSFSGVASSGPLSAGPIAEVQAARTITVASPPYLYSGAGNHTLTLVGSSTDWQTGVTVFTVTAPLVKVSQTITSTTAATMVVTCGSVTSTPTACTVSDGIASTTMNTGVASITASPANVDVNTTGNVVTLTGSYTLWTIDSPTFTLSGGVGASITSQSIISDTSATVTINAGSAGGLLTITDPHPPSTGATAQALVIQNQTSTAFTSFMLDDQQQKVVLAELNYVYQASGPVPATATIYLSSARYTTEPSDLPANVEYRAAIINTPHFTRAINRDTLGGRMTMSVGDLVLDNADHQLTYLLDLIIDGQDVTFYVGGTTWAHGDFRQMFVATMVKAEQRGTQIVIRLKDKAYLVDKGVAPNLIGGTGANATRFLPIVLRGGYFEAFQKDPASNPSRYVVCQQLGTTTVNYVYADGIQLAAGQYVDNGDGSFTLNVSQGNAKLIAHVTTNPTGIDTGPSAGTASQFFTYYWNLLSSQALIYGKHYSWGAETLDVNFSDYLIDRYNPADRMDAVALSSAGFWGTRRDGRMTWGRIRPHHITMTGTDISNGADASFNTPRYTFGDDDVKGDVQVEHLEPKFSRVNVKCMKHATFSNIAAATPSWVVDFWRDEFMHNYSSSGQAGLDYDNGMALYHKTMMASDEIETLHNANFNVFVSNLYQTWQAAIPPSSSASLASWRRDMFSPHVEFRSFTVSLTIYYDLELGDPVACNMPVKVGDSADTTWQVLSIGMDLVKFEMDLTLVRRRHPTTSVVTTP